MLKIALAQMPIIAANPKINFENIKSYVLKALKAKQNLIVFPEMSLSGYFNGDIWEQTSFLKECVFYQEKITELSKDIHIVFGSVGCDWSNKNEDGRIRKYNAAFFASQGKLIINSKTNLCFWPKTLLPNYREFDDSRHFYDLRKLAYEKNCSIEDLYEPIEIFHENEKISIGITLCEDGWNQHYAVSPLEVFTKNHTHQFFLNLSCSPFSTGKKNRREIIFSSHANKINTPIIYVNCVGVQNVGKTIYSFDGSSSAYEKDGNIIELCNSFEDKLGFLEYDLQSCRITLPENAIIKPKVEIIKPSDDQAKYKEIQTALEYSLKQTCKQWNINKIVIGVSGGIDSALCATLMSQALGKQNVFLINMPSQFNSQITKNAAKELSENLGCAYASLSIQNSYDFSQTQLTQLKFNNSSLKTLSLSTHVLENIQARDRGSRILAAVSAAIGGVFTCNANKTELTVGYGTLYGDLAGFLCPIADLWKHEVYGLAQFYNQNIFNKVVIPRASFEIVPSAELSAEQNILEGKGDPLIYPYHDYLFRCWVEDWERKTPEDCLKAYEEDMLDKNIGCEQGLVKKLFPSKELFLKDLERWWILYQGIGAVKRVQAPPVVALSRRAFGYDHRESLCSPLLTNKYFELKGFL